MQADNASAGPGQHSPTQGAGLNGELRPRTENARIAPVVSATDADMHLYLGQYLPMGRSPPRLRTGHCVMSAYTAH